MNMRNQKWQDDFSPIDPDGCEIDRIHSKAYLHHLFKAQELLAMQIASIHNLAFYLRLVTDARQHIEQGDFTQWKRSVIDNLGRRRWTRDNPNISHGSYADSGDDLSRCWCHSSYGYASFLGTDWLRWRSWTHCVMWSEWTDISSTSSSERISTLFCW